MLPSFEIGCCLPKQMKLVTAITTEGNGLALLCFTCMTEQLKSKGKGMYVQTNGNNQSPIPTCIGTSGVDTTCRQHSGNQH